MNDTGNKKIIIMNFRYRGATAALTPGLRRRNPAAPAPAAPSEFDNKDFATRCKFKVRTHHYILQDFGNGISTAGSGLQCFVSE